MREGRKSVYLEANAVDTLKELINEGFDFHWVRLNNMSQVIIALIKEHKQNKRLETEKTENL